MGVPIIQHQAIAFILADMAIQVEASRNLVWKAAWSKDAGLKNSASFLLLVRLLRSNAVSHSFLRIYG